MEDKHDNHWFNFLKLVCKSLIQETQNTFLQHGLLDTVNIHVLPI